MKKYIFTLVIALLPIGASALTVSGYGTGSVNVGAPGVSAGADVSVQNSASSSQEQMGMDNEGHVNADSDNTMNAGVTLKANALGITVRNASQVSSDDDLSVFAENIRAQDAHVALVDTSADGQVAVEYIHRAHFLILFPITITSRTTVSATNDGSVAVHTTLPWWRIFVSGIGDISSTIDTTLATSASLKAAVHAHASANEKAEVAQEVTAALAAQAAVGGESGN